MRQLQLGSVVVMVGMVACGPAPRQYSGLSADAAVVPDARVDAATVLPPPDAAPCGQVLVTYRDFHTTHPDMQKGVGMDTGLVAPLLGSGNKPVYAPSAATATVSGGASFDQWYRDVPGVNTSVQAVLPLVEDPPGTFVFDDQTYFPIDGLGFGDEGNPHNYHFTSEIHTTFTYHGGETFQFSGDDDVFVFVNGHLVIDLGGVHDALAQAVDFDARAAELGLTVGGTYQLEVFHAERHTVSSTFRMETTIDCLIIL
jgi:fibro-slime domain-containing protein